MTERREREREREREGEKACINEEIRERAHGGRGWGAPYLKVVGQISLSTNLIVSPKVFTS